MGSVNPDDVRLSKFLSLVLRHHPERIGLTLDPQGWADVDELLQRAQQSGTPITRASLGEIVARNNKQRFVLSDDRRRIRANQGHSVQVDLALAPVEPPPTLYHGTTGRFLPSIQLDGLTAQRRQHVHLSSDEDTARAVGRRHGPPTVLTVSAGAMYDDGFPFYRSANGVWLTPNAPARYLVFPLPQDAQPSIGGPSRPA